MLHSSSVMGIQDLACALMEVCMIQMSVTAKTKRSIQQNCNWRYLEAAARDGADRCITGSNGAMLLSAGAAHSARMFTNHVLLRNSDKGRKQMDQHRVHYLSTVSRCMRWADQL